MHLRRTVRACLEKGVAVLTVFAFSSENWSRPVEEVSGLMELLALALTREVPKLHKNGVRLHFPGDRTGLSPRVVQGLQKAQEITAGNDRLVLNVCFNYGGRWDIAQAARRLVAEGREITEAALNETTALAHVRRSRSVDSNRWRDAHQQLPAVAGRLCRAVFSHPVCGPILMATSWIGPSPTLPPVSGGLVKPRSR